MYAFRFTVVFFASLFLSLAPIAPQSALAESVRPAGPVAYAPPELLQELDANTALLEEMMNFLISQDPILFEATSAISMVVAAARWGSDARYNHYTRPFFHSMYKKQAGPHAGLILVQPQPPVTVVRHMTPWFYGLHSAAQAIAGYVGTETASIKGEKADVEAMLEANKDAARVSRQELEAWRRGQLRTRPTLRRVPVVPFKDVFRAAFHRRLIHNLNNVGTTMVVIQRALEAIYQSDAALEGVPPEHIAHVASIMEAMTPVMNNILAIIDEILVVSHGHIGWIPPIQGISTVYARCFGPNVNGPVYWNDILAEGHPPAPGAPNYAGQELDYRNFSQAPERRYADYRRRSVEELRRGLPNKRNPNLPNDLMQRARDYRFPGQAPGQVDPNDPNRSTRFREGSQDIYGNDIREEDFIQYHLDPKDDQVDYSLNDQQNKRFQEEDSRRRSNYTQPDYQQKLEEQFFKRKPAPRIQQQQQNVDPRNQQQNNQNIDPRMQQPNNGNRMEQLPPAMNNSSQNRGGNFDGQRERQQNLQTNQGGPSIQLSNGQQPGQIRANDPANWGNRVNPNSPRQNGRIPGLNSGGQGNSQWQNTNPQGQRPYGYGTPQQQQQQQQQYRGNPYQPQTQQRPNYGYPNNNRTMYGPGYPQGQRPNYYQPPNPNAYRSQYGYPNNWNGGRR